jgi:hypothetical protein
MKFTIEVGNRTKEEIEQTILKLKEDLRKPVSFSEEEELKVKKWIVHYLKKNKNLTDEQIEEFIKKMIDQACTLYRGELENNIIIDDASF